jgi:hypothetical protein
MLYEPASGQTGNADLLAASMIALDLALSTALGNGVLTGLTVDSGGHLLVGDALLGHFVNNPASVSVLTASSQVISPTVASSTNYVWWQMPTMTSNPPATGYDPTVVGANGKDVGLIICNTSGSQPANSVLLATVVTNSSNAVTSVNNNPTGRNNLVLPSTLVTTVAQLKVKSLYVPGSIPVVAGFIKWRVPYPLTITQLKALTSTAPTGSSQIFDVKKNGTSVFSTSGNRLIIAAAATSGASAVADNGASCVEGDLITIDCTQAGSTTACVDFMGDLYFK